MKKTGLVVIVCAVLQIVQSEILTLAVLGLAGMAFALLLICKAGERGIL